MSNTRNHSWSVNSAVLVIALILAASSPAYAAKPGSGGGAGTSPCPKNADKPAEITVRNDSGDRIRGEVGTYQDGVDGNSVLLQYTSCLNDVRFAPGDANPVYVDLLGSYIAGTADQGGPTLTDSERLKFMVIDKVLETPITDPDAPGFDPSAFSACPTSGLNSCGQDGTQWFVRRRLNFRTQVSSTSGYENVVKMQCDPEGGDAPCSDLSINDPYETSYVRVQHPNLTTWIIEPEASSSAGGFPAVGTLYLLGRRSSTHGGQYSLPFQLVVEALP